MACIVGPAVNVQALERSDRVRRNLRDALAVSMLDDDLEKRACIDTEASGDETIVETADGDGDG